MNEIYLTDAYGTKWIFYISHTKCLCYTKGGAKDEILTRNIADTFDIVMDENGHFHIICEDTDGTLLYIKYNYHEWKKYEILKSKSGIPKIFSIKLFMADRMPIAFYILEHDGQKLLAEHKIREGLSTAPIIIDILGKNASFCVYLDTKKCFHLFYKNELEKPVYKIAPYGAKTFSNTDFPAEHDIATLSVTEDVDGTIHVSYVANINSYYTMCYYNTKSRIIKNLAFGISAKSTPVVIAADEKIRIQWCDNLRLFECVSSNGGDTFSKPAIIQRGVKMFRVFSGNSTALCISDMPNSFARHSVTPQLATDNAKTSIEHAQLKKRLQSTEARLKQMMEKYDRLSLKLDSISAKIENISQIQTPQKDDTKIIHNYTDIKAKLEASGDNAKDLFDKLNFDDVDFQNAFSVSSKNLPAVRFDETSKP